jgi:hypothetical protein
MHTDTTVTREPDARRQVRFGPGALLGKDPPSGHLVGGLPEHCGTQARPPSRARMPAVLPVNEVNAALSSPPGRSPSRRQWTTARMTSFALRTGSHLRTPTLTRPAARRNRQRPGKGAQRSTPQNGHGATRGTTRGHVPMQVSGRASARLGQSVCAATTVGVHSCDGRCAPSAFPRTATYGPRQRPLPA